MTESEPGRIWLPATIALLLLVLTVVVALTVLETGGSADEIPDSTGVASSAAGGAQPARKTVTSDTPRSGDPDSTRTRPEAALMKPVDAHMRRSGRSPVSSASDSLPREAAPPLALGKVTDAEGRPIAGAHVSLVPPRRPHGSSPRPPHPTASTVTDERGTFALKLQRTTAAAGRVTGTVTLEISAPGYLPTHAEFRPGRERRVVLRRPGSLGGVVATDDEPPRPCVGAHVMLLKGQAVADDGTLAARTDAIGRYRFERLAPGEYRAHVRAEGRRPLTDQIVRVRPREHTRADFSIEAGVSVAGRVTEGEGGRPVPGVSVYTVVTPDRPALTDAEGHYRLTGLPRTVSLMFVKDRYVPRTIPLVVDESARHVDHDTEMVRWAEVRGRVVGLDGRPCEFARVWLVSPRDGTYTDENGSFRLAHVHPGEHIRIEAGRAPSLRGRSAPLTIRSGESVEGVVVRLRPLAPSPGESGAPADPYRTPRRRDFRARTGSAIVKGCVVDPAGDPLAGVRIALLEMPARSRTMPDRLLLMLARRVKRTRADDNGGFAFLDLPAGRYLVETRPAGFLAARGAVFELSDHAVGPDQYLAVERGFRLEVRATDADGNALADIELLAHRRGFGQRDYRRGTTDPDGGSALDSIASGAYRFTVSSGTTRFEPITATVAPGQRLELVFTRRATQKPPTRRFEGRVVFAETGAPAPSFWVRVRGGRGEAEKYFADAAGRFTWKTGGAGTFEIDAGTRDGRISVERAVVDVAEDAPPPLVFLRLAMGAVVEGVVADPEGKPVPHTTVEFHRGTRLGAIACSVRSKSDGAFRASGLREGTYVLVAPTELWVEGTAQIDVAHERPATVRLRMLEHGGTVVARILDHRGRPAPGAELTVKRLNGDPVVPSLPQVKRLFGTARTRHPNLLWSDFFVSVFLSDRHGRLTQHFVPPGRYQVYATRKKAASRPIRVEVVDGRTTPVTLGLSAPAAE